MQHSSNEQPTAAGTPSILAVYDRLASRIRVSMREDELLHLFAGAIREIYPDLMVCFRLLQPGRAGLALVYATGRLRPGARDRLRVVPDGPDAAAMLERSGIEACDRYEPVFQDACGGVDVPLHDGNEVFGILNVEWARPWVPDTAARTVLRTLAAQIATALRDARLVAESIHLRDYLAKLIDHANAPILVIDSGRRIAVFNRFMEGLTGHPRETVGGLDAATLIHEGDRARFLAALAAAQGGKAVSGVEVRIPRRDRADAARISFNLASFVGPDGETMDAVMAVGQDLTEIRRLQEQVIHAEKLATIGQLAAGVVHEINNPLTSISVHADYLHKLVDRGDRQQELTYVGRIREAADRILRFTRDLMAFARPAGDEPDLVDVREVVERAAAFCEHVIGAAGARVERSFDPAPRVYGVHGQIQQVFINLITNACHAMSGVDRERVLTLAVADNGDGRVRVEIGDTGIGIPPEIRDCVFEPFFTTKTQGKGTGLGLSIVRNIVENHHAEIAFTSEPGRGSVFTILFWAT